MKTFTAMVSAIALAAAIGCSKQEEEGAAERAGKQVDETIEKVEEYTSEKVDEMGKAIEHAGEEMQQ
jgi:VIT1/CCC1 family predicted Fe2+/Mn2+ transporter